MQSGNLFSNAASPHVGERFDTLLTHKNLVIERIISSAVIAPQEYIQTQDEWVLLLQGEAELRVNGVLVSLHKGDLFFSPPEFRIPLSAPWMTLCGWRFICIIKNPLTPTINKPLTGFSQAVIDVNFSLKIRAHEEKMKALPESLAPD